MTRKQIVLVVAAAWLIYSAYGLLRVPAEDVARHGWMVVLLGALAYGFGSVAAYAFLIALVIGAIRVLRRVFDTKTTPAIAPPRADESVAINEER